MKGTIFVELIKMAESDFDEDTVDAVLDAADLENGGAYTSVGNYPCRELIKIVTALSARCEVGVDRVQRRFGHWMMRYFTQHYPAAFVGKADAFALLEAVSDEIHVEVKKLYPEVELPQFDTRRLSPGHLQMVYTSPRPLHDFCHGLIEASLDMFDQIGAITATPGAGERAGVVFDIRLETP